MSFSKPRTVVQQAPAAPAAPNPRDDEDRLTTERFRRAMAMRGRASTILTRFMDAPAQNGPVRTVAGG